MVKCIDSSSFLCPNRTCFLGGVIRIKGRNLTESDFIKLGAYHSLELEIGRAFTIFKVGHGQQELPVSWLPPQAFMIYHV